ncbi:aspartyl-phosphate phosphatase Spo0E family protein [Peribacillus frigoritolerans]|uniref:aspartyl-phosphate phosphatase Spo0E family protein n=1 Tax=Peribacillus frigoritolerans TaxID=450367 RepID=UPI00105983C9|nr:aspartyl-phosphate phosphatase Spo0E family protein [Peribacillus frigoritolerans]TDL76123.1 aspartyl-phosphate phosphatase Spo0E family protein [Peribacillus frigoritolerans]
MNAIEQRDLLNEINILRELMMRIANKQGFSSPDTLLYSQKLDKMIYESSSAALNVLLQIDKL